VSDGFTPSGDGPTPSGPDIPDGTYDVFIVDVDEAGPDTLRLSVTILGGEHKGDVVDLTASGLGVDVIDALGMPGTLVVADGEPTLTIDTL
jgi:hypothetical protein